MKKIKIITDSTSDLPKDIIEKYDIEVLPLSINIGEVCYTDGVDIDFKTLLKKINEGQGFPNTSQVTPKKFMDCYNKYLNQGYKIISIHLSSKMRGTYHSACVSKNTIQSDDIVVIDSETVTAGLGLLIMKAYTLIKKEKDIFEIEKELINTIPKIQSILVFDTLEHLVKGGRLSKTSGFIGAVLGIKPILTIKDGEIVVKDKIRGSKKALKYILESLQDIVVDENVPLILLNAENEDIIESLREKLKYDKGNFIESEVGCTVGTHSGPQACGVFFIER